MQRAWKQVQKLYEQYQQRQPRASGGTCFGIIRWLIHQTSVPVKCYRFAT